MKIWIDLDNTPHVPFFAPIIEELHSRGHEVVLSARDAFQVCELVDELALPHTRIGRHYGKNPAMKVAGLLWRSAQLLPFYLAEKPDLALSHGSRAQLLLGNFVRLPTVLITDYEHARTIPMGWPKWTIMPEVLSDVALPPKIDTERVRYYRGIKEDVYAPLLEPDPSLRTELGLGDGEIVAVVRPPASEAHYHAVNSDALLGELMKRLVSASDVRIVMLPRNEHQSEALRRAHPEWFAEGRTVVPARAVNGLNLIWLSDLVVSGGGTMNREAAALGVPVYSVFRGKTGAVDRSLEAEGRLTLVRTPEEVWSKIDLRRRSKSDPPSRSPRPALGDIVDHVESIMRAECGTPPSLTPAAARHRQ